MPEVPLPYKRYTLNSMGILYPIIDNNSILLMNIDIKIEEIQLKLRKYSIKDT